MLRILTRVFIIATLWLFFAGCRKSSSQAITGGGKGGSGTISITPEHSNSFVDSCVVYVKYGTLDAPANGVYDDSVKCVMQGTQPVATFNNLSIGLYYFLGVGYHQLTGLNVKGATTYTMTIQQNKSIYLPTYAYNP